MLPRVLDNFTAQPLNGSINSMSGIESQGRNTNSRAKEKGFHPSDQLQEESLNENHEGIFENDPRVLPLGHLSCKWSIREASLLDGRL
ncbi:hypothetical protein NPIL_282401 [Nephila pilipes]|uniref:Uncharacterized protein n=1 Tax=Nephila pilipes TaxID=299642 RepID=A0A8X6T9U8_NEPPI|nr:hypothetical protein NPIL_282401 [Nephila pilipes]